MIKNIVIFGTFIFIVVIFLLLFRSTLVQQLSITPTPPRNIYIGAWVGDFWNNKIKKIDASKVKQFESEIGKKIAITNYFRGWDELDKPDLKNQLTEISSNGWIPMISANPYFTTKCKAHTEKETIYHAISAGECDQLIKDIAINFKTYNGPVFLRFAWEMNIDTIEWSIGHSGSTPEEFVKAWRRVHDIFKENGANNVIWVFAVNVENDTSTPIEKLYPGDTYTDWVGLDGYNWGETQSWSNWQTFDQVFRPTYDKLVKIAPNKPLMLSEFNSVGIGGDRKKWFIDALDTQIPVNYPEIDAIVFFNEDKRVQENVDWTITGTQNVTEQIKNSLKNEKYKSDLKLDTNTKK